MIVIQAKAKRSSELLKKINEIEKHTNGKKLRVIGNLKKKSGDLTINKRFFYVRFR